MPPLQPGVGASPSSKGRERRLTNGYRNARQWSTVAGMNAHETAAQILHEAFGDAIDDVELSLLAEEIVQDLDDRLRQVAGR